MTMKFGRLTFVGEAAPHPVYKGIRWRFTCDCGNDVVNFRAKVVSGSVKSCGCLKRTQKTHVTHGLSGTDEFNIHQGIKNRCYNPSVKNFRNYGGRGISVCDRWLRGNGEMSGVECFVVDMGPRPSKSHSVERRDTNGNYEPSNCYWATPKEQGRNKRNSRLIEVSGRMMPIVEAIEMLGANVHRDVVACRLANGWTPEDALKPPATRKSEETRRKMSEAAKRRHARAA